MGKGLCILMGGIFVGALAYELFRRTEIAKTMPGKISEGCSAVKEAFMKGYRREDNAVQGTEA